VLDASFSHFVSYISRCGFFTSCEDGIIRSVLCGEDFYIEDIKEELSCYPGQVQFGSFQFFSEIEQLSFLFPE
jgi:hypothetical protein